jgi:hypothetical protein
MRHLGSSSSSSSRSRLGNGEALPKALLQANVLITMAETAAEGKQMMQVLTTRMSFLMAKNQLGFVACSNPKAVML